MRPSTSADTDGVRCFLLDVLHFVNRRFVPVCGASEEVPCSFRIRSRCLLDNSAGQWRPISQSNGCAVGSGFVAFITQSVCKFVPNRQIEQVFDGHMPYRTKLHAASRCSDH